MARAWHLKSRPQGMPTSDNFELKEVALPPLGEGMIEVATAGCRSTPTCAGV
jgi:Putative NADP-dependent oxidoreductases